MEMMVAGSLYQLKINNNNYCCAGAGSDKISSIQHTELYKVVDVYQENHSIEEEEDLKLEATTPLL